MYNIKCVSIHFVRNEHRRPNKSGTYLVHTSAGSFTSISYSKRHDAWNCDDDDDDEETLPRYAFPPKDPYIVAWADLKIPRDQLADWRQKHD